MSHTRNKLVFTLVAALVAVVAVAAPFSVVKEAGSGKDPVSLKGLNAVGDAGVLFKNVLQGDLVRSGWFEVDNGQYSSLSVSGTATGQGASLSTSVNVSWTGGAFNWSQTTSGMREARWQAHMLCDEMVKRIKNRQGMAASRIAFVGKEGRGGMICLCDSDGASLQKFSPEGTSPLSPYFSPDGRYIYYTSFLRGFACVYRVATTGGAREPLANFTGLNAGGAVSPNGRLIAVILSHPGNPELFVVNVGTRKATRLTHTPRGAEASPCWSPDGERIAYVNDEGGTPQIYVIDSETKAAKRISFKGSQNVAPTWGPDGRIAYCSKQGGYQIVVYDPRNGEAKIVSDGRADYEDPSWAPDGRHIICSRRDGRAYSLVILDTEGDAPVKLPLPAGDWRAPDWSSPLRP